MHEPERASTKLLNLCSAHNAPRVPFSKNPMRSIARHVRKLERESSFVSAQRAPRRRNRRAGRRRTRVRVDVAEVRRVPRGLYLSSTLRDSKLTARALRCISVLAVSRRSFRSNLLKRTRCGARPGSAARENCTRGTIHEPVTGTRNVRH
ncbi:unnamed protein product [Euphydryas editha]|uniref:Uncharacterized protein n=1 Tax=Euphydryas editha TaxID=104508 RepID=A0AAU9U6N5_EUPED|nr:unnamed protein product [Euphydryas editha]